MKYLLLDGFNLAFRAHFAMPDLSRADGLPTGALHGWVKAIWKVLDLEKPDVIAVYFDEGGASAREALFADYKGQRPEMPEALSAQMPLIREVTGLLGVPWHREPGVEADDLIAAAAVRLAGAGHEVVIVSADKDFGQLLGPGIVQLLPAPTANPKLGWRRRDAADLEANLGVRPDQVPAYLALIGDTADNIPGVPGIGPKTAARLLRDYGDLEGVLAHADHLNPRFREALPAAAERLRLNLALVTLDCSVSVPEPVPVPVELPALLRFFESMGMKASAREAESRYGDPNDFRLE